MDTVTLRKFLKCGFMEKGKVYQTLAGTPQGGVISPALAVMALSELERELLEAIKKNNAIRKRST